MNSLVYLVLTGAKNWLKELIRKPGKLILYLLIIASMAGVLMISVFTHTENSENIPMFWLKGIYSAFIVLFLLITLSKGLTSGDAIFDMSDVNLLFVSPVNPRSILLYGLVRLAKTSFLASFFILFQSSSLANFGVRFGGLMVMFAIFVLNMVLLSLLSLVIYTVTNGRPARKNAVRAIFGLIFAPVIVFFAVQAVGGDVLSALQSAIQSPLLSAIPFVGWTAACTVCFLSGQWAAAIGWLGLMLLCGAGMLCYIMLSRADYYEDVLVATETFFEKKRAMEQGDINAAGVSMKKVKVKQTGLSGLGAAVFFYKHLRETFRQRRFGFLSLYTVVMFVCVMAAAFFLQGKVSILMILMMLMWMQVFMIGTGHGLKETFIHYIYMAPEPPFKKVVWSNMEVVFQTLTESVLLLLAPGVVMGGSLPQILGCMAVYTLFSMLLLGINYLFMRWTGANLSQGILVSIYFAAVIVAVAPGLVPALIVALTVGGERGSLLALLIFGAWELAAALGCFALSKNVLQNCDMPNMRPMGK